MPWKPGESGNPEGGRVKARRFAYALDRALTQEESLKAEDERRIRLAVEKLLDKCAAGDLASLQFLAERLDGKVPQGVEHTGADGGAIIIKSSQADDGLV